MRPIRYAKVLHYLKGIHKDLKILEVGCGEGSGLLMLRNFGFKNLVGTEISEERLKSARKKLPADIDVYATKADNKLPFDDDSFDVVVSLAVIEHIVSVDAFLQEITRVTKKSARIIISSDCFSWRILQCIGLYKSVMPFDKTHTYLGFKNIFKNHNLSIKHFDVFNLPSRGPILTYYTTGRLFRKIFKQQCKAPIKKENLKTEDRFNRIKNWFYDENIFLLEKIGEK
jgi:SAM-dependent methyltransferase